MEGKDGKTERATPRKRSEERRKGNLCVSNDVTSLAVLLCGVLAMRYAVPGMFHKLQGFLADIARFDLRGPWSPETVRRGFVDGSLAFAALCAPILVPTLLGSILGNMGQTGPYFSTQAFKLKLSGLNPVKGLLRLFSAEAATQLVLGTLKLAIVVLTAYVVCRKEVPMLIGLQNTDLVSSARWMMLLIFRLALTVCVVAILIAVLDWCFRKRQYEKGLMMSKQEVKDEHRQHEPSPLIRKAVARRMRQLTLARMMAAVPNANVVITNPDHVAVAIEYDSRTMSAPRVTAKGLRLMAERIKQVAREHNVPIVRRPETARALYKHVEVGHMVPASLFRAVAEILAYLHKLGRNVGLNAA
jgi:flagellar biosynthesis protein FlhB